MIDFFLELIVHLIITLTLVRIMFGKSNAAVPNRDESKQWKTAAESMALLETRLEQLTLRDMKHQERVWALEDLNRDLQTRLTKLGTGRSPIERQPMFDLDDDEDDQDNSIPPNN